MTSHTSFDLRLPQASYPIHCGENILSHAELWPRPQGQNKRALVFVDSALGDFSAAIQQGLEGADWAPQIIELEGSEDLKDFQALYPLYGQLLEAGIQRRSLLVAVGGGTVGDAIGFLAATYLRGVDWVNIPSTLLAQVDSCLGGKTAVNHQAGKNLIGAFHQPAAILCDVAFLAGISERDRVSGYGEMLKYGQIADADFGEWLLQRQASLLSYTPDVLAEAVQRSLAIKASFVEQDELDLTGLRAILNFGHTFGHAYETASGYGYFRHGEAVLLGMHTALHVSLELGLLESESAREQARRHMHAIRQLPLPRLPDFQAQALIEVMKHDKKNDGAEITCLLSRGVGKIQARGMSEAELMPLLQGWLQLWREAEA